MNKIAWNLTWLRLYTGSLHSCVVLIQCKIAYFRRIGKTPVKHTNIYIGAYESQRQTFHQKTMKNYCDLRRILRVKLYTYHSTFIS